MSVALFVYYICMYAALRHPPVSHLRGASQALAARLFGLSNVYWSGAHGMHRFQQGVIPTATS